MVKVRGRQDREKDAPQEEPLPGALAHGRKNLGIYDRVIDTTDYLKKSQTDNGDQNGKDVHGEVATTIPR